MPSVPSQIFVNIVDYHYIGIIYEVYCRIIPIKNGVCSIQNSFKEKNFLTLLSIPAVDVFYDAALLQTY